MQDSPIAKKKAAPNGSGFQKYLNHCDLIVFDRNQAPKKRGFITRKILTSVEFVGIDGERIRRRWRIAFLHIFIQAKDICFPCSHLCFTTITASEYESRSGKRKKGEGFTTHVYFGVHCLKKLSCKAQRDLARGFSRRR